MNIYRPMSSMFFRMCLLAVAGCKGKAPVVAELPPPEVTVCKPIDQRDYRLFFHVQRLERCEGKSRCSRQVSGYIVKINFVDGQEVKKGDLLVEIDTRPYQAALDKAQADVARNRAALIKAKADLSRSEKLLPTKAISQEDYDQAVAAKSHGRRSIAGSRSCSARCTAKLGFHQSDLAHTRTDKPPILRLEI